MLKGALISFSQPINGCLYSVIEQSDLTHYNIRTTRSGDAFRVSADLLDRSVTAVIKGAVRLSDDSDATVRLDDGALIALTLFDVFPGSGVASCPDLASVALFGIPGLYHGADAAEVHHSLPSFPSPLRRGAARARSVGVSFRPRRDHPPRIDVAMQQVWQVHRHLQGDGCVPTKPTKPSA